MEEEEEVVVKRVFTRGETQEECVTVEGRKPHTKTLVWGSLPLWLSLTYRSAWTSCRRVSSHNAETRLGYTSMLRVRKYPAYTGG